MNSLVSLLAAVATALPLPSIGVAQAQDPDYRFSRPMRPGQTLAIGNIDGSVTVTRASGGTATVLVTKRVIRGNGSLVKAILDEESSNRIKVCTVYLREVDEQRTDCDGRNHGDGRRREPLEVEMTYEVQLPEGVELDVGTVDGDVIVSGLAARASLATVDGTVEVTGRAPERVSTVDGDIIISAEGTLPSDLRYSTVDGDVRLTLPGSAGFAIQASSIDGTLESDFPITVRGRWGPRSMQGTVGDGRSTIRVSTVDGAVAIRRR